MTRRGEKGRRVPNRGRAAATLGFSERFRDRRKVTAEAVYSRSEARAERLFLFLDGAGVRSGRSAIVEMLLGADDG